MMHAPHFISTLTAKANPTYNTRSIAKVSTETSAKKGLRQKDSLLTQSPCDAGQEVCKQTNELTPRRSGLHSSSSESLIEFYGRLHLFKTVVDERQTTIEQIHLRG